MCCLFGCLWLDFVECIAIFASFFFSQLQRIRFFSFSFSLLFLLLFTTDLRNNKKLRQICEITQKIMADLRNSSLQPVLIVSKRRRIIVIFFSVLITSARLYTWVFHTFFHEISFIFHWFCFYFFCQWKITISTHAKKKEKEKKSAENIQSEIKWKLTI